MRDFDDFCKFDVGWCGLGVMARHIYGGITTQLISLPPDHNLPLDIQSNPCYIITMTLKTLLSKLDLYKGNLIIKTQDANILYNSRVLNSSYDEYLNNQVIRVYIDFELNTCYVYIYL